MADDLHRWEGSRVSARRCFELGVNTSGRQGGGRVIVNTAVAARQLQLAAAAAVATATATTAAEVNILVSYQAGLGRSMEHAHEQCDAATARRHDPTGGHHGQN